MCTYLLFGYIHLYVVFVCLYVVYEHMFFFRALATLRRGALLPFAAFAAVFRQKPSSLLPYLLPVPCVPDLRPFLCPFGRFLHSCVPFAVPCVPNVCDVHCIRFLSGFKRVNCVARTFAPFALFRAVV